MDRKLIYVVDDEENIRELLRYNFKEAGFEVEAFGNGSSFLGALKQRIPDLICLDIMLPDVDGVELCKKIRQNDSFKKIPIIFLTAKTGEYDTIVGLESGGDDYIRKPFSVNELKARVRALLRRHENLGESTVDAEDKDIITIKDIRIDLDKREVYKGEEKLKLTLKEYELLKRLALGKGKVYTRESLLNDIWGYDYFGDGRTVDVHVHNLRRLLKDKDEDYIITVRGVGYKFNN